MISSLAQSPTPPVLIVDDDEAFRSMIEMGLSLMGYPTETADSLGAAKECLRRRAYSLVLCDYEMPDGTGFDLLAHVNSAFPSLPVILVTGYDETTLARQAITSGALDFLCKPFELRQLARLIEQNRARLERDRERTARLTREVLNGTIQALVAAVDAKDPHTAFHSERVTRLALRLGTAVHLSEDEMQVLEFSALLHDVGKIAVPEQVLLKPGRLDATEWETIRQHPVRSAEIVRQVGALADVATIVRHHHERIDGGGYPDGLCGDAIPPLARIVALADAYEAMTSDRAYRCALSIPEARQAIRDGLGSHFDAGYGEAFLGLSNLP